MDYFLCLETSMEEGSVGVFKKEKNHISSLSYKKWIRSHSEKLPIEIQNVIKDSGLQFSDLSFLGVGQGPGRFTGVRTAINVIRSISFSLKIPVFPKNTLRILAEPFLNKQEVSVVCNAFKNSVYFTKISKTGESLVPPCVLPVSEWLSQKEQSFYIGDAWNFYSLPEEFKKKNLFKEVSSEACSLAQLIGREFQKEEGLSWFDLQPAYLRSLEHERRI